MSKISKFAACLILSSGSVTADADPTQELELYVGSWTVLGAGSENWRETCAWLPAGGRHVVCQGRDKVDGVPSESLSVYSYDAAAREYVYHGFRPDGSFESERGQRTATGFLFASDKGSGAERVRTRFTVTELGNGHFLGTSEIAKGDGPFVVRSKAEYVRSRGVAQ